MNRRTYKGNITHLNSNEIFVFGSNPEGRHGAGTAKIAANKFGAVYGQGRGLQGKSYGLITKNLRSGYREIKSNGEVIIYSKNGGRSVTKSQIIDNIVDLYKVAGNMKNHYFIIAYRARGSNLNGYSDTEMSEMFREAGEIYGSIAREPKNYNENNKIAIPFNVVFEDSFHRYIFK